MSEMPTFTAEELARFDGRDGGPVYVAYGADVYDVSQSFSWRDGRHRGVHPAGTDLTAALMAAPHGDGLLKRFPVVGQLLAGENDPPPAEPPAAG